MTGISTHLHAALKKINRSGAFCVTGSESAPLPGLEVNGLGPVSFPLNVESARIMIACCRQAPYGKGSLTILDTRVRQVATLVIVLPSAFTGGELVVRHDGQERVVDFSQDSAFQTQFAAFYADCEHEIRPLRTGHRVCLVYNLTLAKSKKKVSAPRTSEHVEEVARVLRGWTNDDGSPHKLVVPLEHQYTPDGLTWGTLKGVDRVKAAVLHQAANLADCRAYLALLTFWESASVEEVDHWSSRRQRGHHHDPGAKSDDYEIIETIDSSLTLAHWSDVDGGKPSLGEMGVEEDEVVPAGSLTRVQPEQDVSGYTGNEGLTMERWYRHAAIVVWPKAHEFEVLCDCGSTVAIAELQRHIGKGKPDASTRASGIAFARTILALCTTHCETKDANRLLTSLVALDDPELVRVFLRDVVTPNRSVQPGDELRTVLDRHGWMSFEPELATVFQATSSSTLERNVALLAMLGQPKRNKADAERRVVCGRLAEIVVSRIEAIDKAADATHDWRLRDVNRSAVLVGLCQALLTTSQDIVLLRLIRHSLKDAKSYPLSVHIQALTQLQPCFRSQLKQHREVVAEWVAAVRAQLEGLTAAEPQTPTDFRREASVSCQCAECKELKRFLQDPTEPVHRFRVVQEKRTHLEDGIRRGACDVKCQTERVGSPHTLVCTKTTASFEARLKKYHEDSQHLETVRVIERSLPK